MTNFALPLNNLVTTLGATHEAGATTLALASGFGAQVTAALAELGLSLSGGAWLRVTVVVASAVDPAGGITDRTRLTIFRATGLSADTLTGVGVIEGRTDLGFSAGDPVGFFATGGSFLDLQSAVDAIQTDQATDETNIGDNTSSIAALVALEATTVYTTGSYADPSWLTALSASKLTTGSVPAARLPVFVASGAGHSPGAVPDPGASAGTARFLREDSSFAVPAGGAPGGSPTWVQVNVAGAFGGYSNFTYDGSGLGVPRVTSAGTSLALEQTGDELGGSSLTLLNRSGINGARLANAALDLVDFSLQGVGGTFTTLRHEAREGGPLGAGNAFEFELYNSSTGAWLVSGSATTQVRSGDLVVGAGTGAASIRSDGTLQLVHLADSSAADDSWYYSTTGSAPSYKDGGGTVHPLTGPGGGSGTVTSVALAAPGIFSVSGSPVTTSGTLTLALATQSANAVWAGPTTGAAAGPTFRALVAADVPAIAEAQVTNLTADLAARLVAANNLSDVAGAATARTNLGLGSVATQTATAVNIKGQIDSHFGTITGDTDGATITFDCSATDWHQVTLGGNRTLALSGDVDGQQSSVVLKQDATGSRTVTWWAGILWPGGTAPTLTTTANKRDVFTFKRLSSGVYLGFTAGLGL